MTIHNQFGIDEVYVHKALNLNLLEKLQQRAEMTFDGTDTIIKKHASHDFVLVFHKRVPNRSFIHRFLESLSKHPKQIEYIESNTLFNEEELFEAIKSKTFVLVTTRTVIT